MTVFLDPNLPEQWRKELAVYVPPARYLEIGYTASSTYVAFPHSSPVTPHERVQILERFLRERFAVVWLVEEKPNYCRNNYHVGVMMRRDFTPDERQALWARTPALRSRFEIEGNVAICEGLSNEMALRCALDAAEYCFELCVRAAICHVDEYEPKMEWQKMFDNVI